MKAYLFVGGPWHGQMHEVEDGTSTVNIPVPSSDVRDTQTGVPILGMKVVYTLRKMGIRTRLGAAVRYLYVDSDLSPAQAQEALSQLLLAIWITDDPDIVDRCPA